MRTVKGMKLKVEREMKIKEMIYNDSDKDFKISYAYENNPPQEYEIKAGAILKNIPRPIARHIRKHLVDHIMICRKLKVIDGKKREKIYQDTKVEI